MSDEMSMEAVTAEEGAMEPAAFYRDLVDALEAKRAKASPAEAAFGATRQMGHIELTEWLRFQAWYEREAANFIGSWLADTPEPEAFFGLCTQVADEGKHCKMIVSHLKMLGESMDGWVPEPEWVEWVQEFYASGDDTLERVSAHNITGEIGAMNAFENLRDRVPEKTRAVIEKIMPDEAFHVSLGKQVVLRYATTADRQRRVRNRVMKAYELEQKGRVAFDRRLEQLGAGKEQAADV